MLFQSTHEDRQGAEALAEPGERMAKSPLQRTLTAHIMSRWVKHEGALAHISLKRSIEMLVPKEKAKQMHLNWNPLGFMSDLSTNKLETRFPPDVWQAFFHQEVRSAHPQDACPRAQSHALLLQDVY